MRTALPLCLLLPLILLPDARAQKEPMEEPEIWKEVKYDIGEFKYIDEDKNKRTDYEKFSASKRDNKEAWRVFSDRESIPIYDGPDGKVVGSVPGFSTRLYVYKEEDTFVCVSEQNRGPGNWWCRKTDLVLWRKPYKDPVTGIEIKAFVVNTVKAAGEIALDANKEKYKVLAGPSPTATVLKEKFIYDVLFVYKYVPGANKGDGYYLVSQNDELSSGDDLGLLGWVSEKRVKTWGTRLCLEPNFAPEALAERKSTNTQAKLFAAGAQSNMEAFLKNGSGEGLVDGPQRDPAFGKDPQRDPRMSGRLFRYPVFGAGRGALGPDNCTFQTGVSGITTITSGGVLEDFNNEQLQALSEKYDRIQKRLADVNVVFVIDGSLGTQDHLAMVNAAVDALSRKYKDKSPIEFSCVVYRNELSGQADEGQDPLSNYCERFGPTASAAQFKDRLSQVVPRNEGDKSDQRAVYFGLKQGIDLCQDDETNILIHLGRSPDNSANPFFESAKKHNGTRVDVSDLADLLKTGKGIHYLGYVTTAEGSKVTPDDRARLSEGLNEVVQNMANTLNNYFGGSLNYAEKKRDADAPKPVTGKAEGMKSMRMANTPFLMKTFFMDKADQGPSVIKSIQTNADSCVMRSQKVRENLELLFKNESQLKDYAGDFSMRNALDLMLQGVEDPVERDRIKSAVIAQKIHVFADARAYYKTDNVKLPLFRYVLFYKDADLDAQIKALRDLNQMLDNTNSEVATQGFIDYWQAKAEKVLGSEYHKKTMKAVDLLERLEGVQNMDMVKPFVRTDVFGDLTIQDLLGGKKLAPEQFKQYQAMVQESFKKLSELRDEPYYYQVAEGQGSKFYWVPIEYLFN